MGSTVCYKESERAMSKLKVVKKGWRLDAILTVSVAAATFKTGRLPFFEPSVMGKNGEVETPGGWRGGEKWQASSTPLPWGLPGVV